MLIFEFAIDKVSDSSQICLVVYSEYVCLEGEIGWECFVGKMSLYVCVFIGEGIGWEEDAAVLC